MLGERYCSTHKSLSSRVTDKLANLTTQELKNLAVERGIVQAESLDRGGLLRQLRGRSASQHVGFLLLVIASKSVATTGGAVMTILSLLKRAVVFPFRRRRGVPFDLAGVPSGLRAEIMKAATVGVAENTRKTLIESCKSHRNGFSLLREARQCCNSYRHLSAVSIFADQLDEAISGWQQPRAPENADERSFTKATGEAMRVVLIADFAPKSFFGFVDQVLAPNGVTRADFPKNWNIKENLHMIQVSGPGIDLWDKEKCAKEIMAVAAKFGARPS